MALPPTCTRRQTRAMPAPQPRWRSPSELVEIGFTRSRVVMMMNEAHSGLRRSVRTRIVGKSILPAAHEAGVRHLAMEALRPAFAAAANENRVAPDESHGYLSQPEMRDLIAAALDLGWTLVPYEADFDSKPRAFANLSWEERTGVKSSRRSTSSRRWPPFARKESSSCGAAMGISRNSASTSGARWDSVCVSCRASSRFRSTRHRASGSTLSSRLVAPSSSSGRTRSRPSGERQDS